MSDLEEKINELLSVHTIENAIELVESEMLKISDNLFECMIGKDLKHLSYDLLLYVEKFILESNKMISKEYKTFNIYRFLQKKNYIKAIYCEMNGTHNDDWSLELFAFDSIEDKNNRSYLDNFDFKTDSYNAVGSYFYIKGLEDVESAYLDYYENEMYEDLAKERSAELCSMLVILRIQQLFKYTYDQSLHIKSSKWKGILTIIEQHDDNIVYRIN